MTVVDIDIRNWDSGLSSFLTDHGWPVGLSEVAAVRDAFNAGFAAFVRERGLDRDIDAELLWLAAPQLMVEVSECYMAQALVHRYRKTGIDIRFGKQSLINAIAMKTEPPASVVLRRIQKGIPSQSPIKRIAIALAAPWRGSRLSRRPPWAMSDRLDVLTFNVTPLIHVTAEAEGLSLVLGDRADWLPPGPHRVEALPDLARDSSRQTIIDVVRHAFAAGGEATLSPAVETRLLSVIRAMTGVGSLYLAALERRSRYLPARFWANSFGAFHNRVMARAIERAGGECRAFDHGTGSGWWRLPSRTLVEYAVARRFITYTEAQARGEQADIDPALLADPTHTCRIEAAPRMAAFAPLSTDHVIASSGPRRVMYISTLYPGEKGEIVPLPPDLVQADWQDRLFGQLRQRGMDILFRPHPESRTPPPETLLRRHGVRVAERVVEQSLADADLLLFDWPQSTAFVAAIRSRHPIVFIDLGIIPISEAARPLLEQRVAVVRAGFDDKGRILCDWPALEAAFDLAVARASNGSFAREYYRWEPATTATC